MDKNEAKDVRDRANRRRGLGPFLTPVMQGDKYVLRPSSWTSNIHTTPTYTLCEPVLFMMGVASLQLEAITAWIFLQWYVLVRDINNPKIKD